MKSWWKNRHPFSLVIPLALILSFLFLLFPWSKANTQQNPVPLSEIYKVLTSPNSTAARRNQLLIEQVKKRGVTFSLTPEMEKELRTGGATDELIKVIEQGAPKPVISDFLKNGDGFRQKGDCGSALAEYTKAINSKPQPAAFYGRGLCYLKQMDYGRSGNDFKEAARLDNKQAEAFFYLGISFDYQGDFPNAAKNYQEALKLKADIQPALVMKCLSASSVDGCTSAIGVSPDFTGLLYYKRGNAYLGRKDFDNAVKDYLKASELSSKFTAVQNNLADALNLRGLNYYSQNDLARAASDFTEAIKLKPESYAPYLNRCGTYIRQVNLEAAVKDCEKVIAINPKYPDAYYLRGFIYERQGNYQQAVVDYRKVMELDPRNVIARNSWIRLNYSIPLSNLNQGTTEWEDERVKSKFSVKRDGNSIREIKVHFDDLKKYAAKNKYLILWAIRPDGRCLKIGQLFVTGERKEGDIKNPDKDREARDIIELSVLGSLPFGLFVTEEDGFAEQPSVKMPFSIFNDSKSRSDSAAPGSPTMKKQP